MFTGLIEEVGVIAEVHSGPDHPHLAVRASKLSAAGGLAVGDSVAVNGVCLTVRALSGACFEADAMPITLSRTNLGALECGSEVNLERAMALGGRLGGHMVAGHVDGVGRVRHVRPDGPATLVSIEVGPSLGLEMVQRGSVAIDGVSLTVASLTDSICTVSLVPHTRRATTLDSIRPGTAVNVETDLVGKYVRSFLTRMCPDSPVSGGITLDHLAELGF